VNGNPNGPRLEVRFPAHVIVVKHYLSSFFVTFYLRTGQDRTTLYERAGFLLNRTLKSEKFRFSHGDVERNRITLLGLTHIDPMESSLAARLNF